MRGLRDGQPAVAKSRSDEGSAVIEFVGFAVLVLVPLAYLMVTVFAVQRAAFAAGSAAREAGRAFVLADSTDDGLQRAELAAHLAMQSQGLGDGELAFHEAGSSCSSPTVDPSLEAGESYVVCYRVSVALPFADRGYLAGQLHAADVTGEYALVVDDFRSSR